MSRKIYVASSWRTDISNLISILRQNNHEVYDFKASETSFSWNDIDTNWKEWSFNNYIEALQNPLAEKGFNNDFNAMKWADTCILLLPCGRSAHLELGWMSGQNKDTIILSDDNEEPELMNLLANRIFKKDDYASLLSYIS